MQPVNHAKEDGGADIFEILDKDTQTNENTVKISEGSSKAYRLPLPRDLDQANRGNIRALTSSQVLQDPSSIGSETYTPEVHPDSNSPSDFSNSSSKKVTKPCLKNNPADCNSCKELVPINAVINKTSELHENQPYSVCHKWPPSPCPRPSCPPRCPPKCPPPRCRSKNHLKICCGVEGEPTICKECTKQTCPTFECPKPYIPPCSPPLPCPPVCRPPPCPPVCRPPPCPPKCPPPPCPPKCPPPPCPPKCSPPPCPTKCSPPPCPPKCTPPPCPPKCPSPPCACSGPKSGISQILFSIKSMTGLTPDCNCMAKSCCAKPCLPLPPRPPPVKIRPPCRPPVCANSRAERKFLCPNQCPNVRNISYPILQTDLCDTCSPDDMPPFENKNEHVIGTTGCAKSDLMGKAFKSEQEVDTVIKTESVEQLESLKNSVCFSNAIKPDGKTNPNEVNNSCHDTSVYNFVNIEENLTSIEPHDSEMNARSRSPFGFLHDKVDSAVSMISGSLVYELPRPSNTFNNQNSDTPTASKPMSPTDVENMMFPASSSLFSSIQEMITSIFTGDDEKTLSPGRSPAASLASESDEDLLTRLID